MKLDKKSAVRLGALGVLLAAAWVLPPALHKTLHYCPVRPDGVSQAEAVPAFARKYGFSCMQCHSNWPTLNDYGRQFKMNGYVPSRDSEEGVLKTKDASLWIERNFPLSVIVRSRPFDQNMRFSGGSKDQEFKMAPVQDVDMFFAGGDAAHHVSWFGEVDANNGNSFSLSAADLQLGYHYNEYLNVIGARRGFFVMDPYQTLSNFGSPTLAARGVAGSQITDLPPSLVQMDQTAQTVYAYGEVGSDKIGYLYYAAGASADKGQDAGTGGKIANGRLAFDTTKGLVVGAFGSYGHAGATSYGGCSSSDFNAGLCTTQTTAPSGTPIDRTLVKRAGMDLLVEKGPVTARAAYLYAYDHDIASYDATNFPNGNSKETNRAAYAELQYVHKLPDGKIPSLVPLVRQSWYTTDNSKRQFGYFTAQLAHYFAANVKTFVECSWDTKQDVTGADVPNAARNPKGHQLTGQIEIGF